MNFIVIEGLDGSGKSSQIKMLQDYLAEKKIKFQYLHFPRHNTPVFGDLIARFLRGELGENDSVNPYLVALIYASDRKDAAPMIKKWMNDGYVVVLDRYVNSNIAFQCAKTVNPDEKKKLAEWIINLEYQYYEIPKPDLTMFLDVPFDFTMQKLSGNRSGADRDYLKGNRDIHEADLDFQKRVRDSYIMISQFDKKMVVIDCSDGKGNILPQIDVFKKIIKQLEKKLPGDK